jgi:hypothetical protein
MQNFGAFLEREIPRCGSRRQAVEPQNAGGEVTSGQREALLEKADSSSDTAVRGLVGIGQKCDRGS